MDFWYFRIQRHAWFSVVHALSWCRGRFPWSCCSADHNYPPVALRCQVVVVLLCRSSRFFVLVCVKPVETPQCSSSYSCLDKVVDTPAVAQMQFPMVLFYHRDSPVAVHCEGGRRVLCRLLHARCVQQQMPWWRTWRSSSTVMDVPLIMQRRLRQWKCPMFSSSSGLVDIFVRNRGVGMVAAMRVVCCSFAAFFGLRPS